MLNCNTYFFMSLGKIISEFHIKYNTNKLFVNINHLKNSTLHTGGVKKTMGGGG